MTKTQKHVLHWTLTIVFAALIVVSVRFMLYCRKLNTLQKCKFTRRSIEAVQKAVTIYAMQHNGNFPVTLGELTHSSDDQEGLLNESSLIDCWRNSFKYETQLNSFTITSAGPDRKMGTKDDITNR